MFVFALFLIISGVFLAGVSLIMLFEDGVFYLGQHGLQLGFAESCNDAVIYNHGDKVRNPDTFPKSTCI